ncbi:type VI secretion system-associated FHA domain protein TagH [Acidiphilium sp.]|uniref:type VI secretion system-associated FHA domain protein TagH n=1 Tax=Acidiphilium sp. TaxID=527 RepID=UPI002582CE10|nr:type VI secretion system-associated FHA domain protein TagH [Acidiphilium sp.]
MTLTLSVLRCPDAAPPETRSIEGGEFRIGRGPDNDWVLTDPDRVLSKRHCVIAWRAGAWQIADTSTNGTFVNQDIEPLGAGRVHALSDGDRIRLGSYEIEARLVERGFGDAGYGGGFGAAPATRPDPFADPFGEDPFAKPAAPASSPVSDEWFGGGNSISMPDDFAGLPDDDALFGPTPVPDHSPAQNDVFRPAPMAPKLLPDDWDLGLEPGANTASAGPAWTAPSPLPPPAEIQPPPPAAPAPPAPLPPAPVPPAPLPPAPLPAGAPGGDLLRVFLEAAGMDGLPPPADPELLMRRLAGLFRAMVGGLRQVMIARAAIKGEFRIEQTMIRARGNNPLKFSADDDDAMAALIGLGRRTSDLQAEEAVRDALRDIRLHEIAVMSGMQAAVRALFARLDPAPLRAEAESARALLPAQRKARAFEAYETLYGQLSAALADDFDNVFGKTFARAYERALSDAEASET